MKIDRYPNTHPIINSDITVIQYIHIFHNKVQRDTFLDFNSSYFKSDKLNIEFIH